MGHLAIQEVAQGFMTAFPDLHLSMDQIRVAGARTEYHWTFVGHNTGPGGTGKRVRFSGVESWAIGDDGLIAESTGRFDVAEYRRQLENGI